MMTLHVSPRVRATRTLLLGASLLAMMSLSASCKKKDDAKKKTPTATNPCGAKTNPCGAKTNPCGAKANPCGAKANPCGANPCGANAKIDSTKIREPKGWKANAGKLSPAALLAKGEAMFKDKSVGKSGAACQTCHGTPALYKPYFAKPYRHTVAMAKERAGMDDVSAAEMVQLCMKVPMKGDPLAWDSVELAALTAVVLDRQAKYVKMGKHERMGHGGKMANPCGGKAANPCGGKAKNPCGSKAANPCGAAKNPCGGKAANPCGAKAKNPCGK